MCTTLAPTYGSHTQPLIMPGLPHHEKRRRSQNMGPCRRVASSGAGAYHAGQIRGGLLGG
jgi:hypothetical protein